MATQSEIAYAETLVVHARLYVMEARDAYHEAYMDYVHADVFGTPHDKVLAKSKMRAAREEAWAAQDERMEIMEHYRMVMND